MSQPTREAITEYLRWQHTLSPLLMEKPVKSYSAAAPAPDTNAAVVPESVEVKPLQPVHVATEVHALSGDAPTQMALLTEQTKDCMQCRLGATRTKLVFGDGNVHASLMFIGEGPGRDEDLQGLPFVGKAGQLLTKIIENGLKIPRSSVYIANIVKCRPPENREPFKDEAEACIGYLKKQIAIIQPKAIVLLGKTALLHLLHSDLSIAKARETAFEYQGIRVFVTYHPSALLRNENLKRPTWDDMKKVMGYLGLTNN